MSNKLSTNEKTLSQIVIQVTFGWAIFLCLILLIIFLIDGNFDSLVILSILSGVALIAMLTAPFGAIGGAIGKSWLKTQRSTWVGTIFGIVFGTILVVAILVNFVGFSL